MSKRKPNLNVLMWRTCLLMIALIMQQLLAVAQQQTVKGTVRDEKGTPFPALPSL